MTRLTYDWIKNISNTIMDTEEDLIYKTGLDYITLASLASGVPKEEMNFASKNIKVAVIPITTGLGLINTFSESVAGILKHMNFEAFITQRTDVDGIYEAYQKGAKIIFLADDSRFLAINLEKNLVIDNNLATAKGFATALEGAIGSLNKKEVLVIGCGIVGKEMLKYLKKKEAIPIAYDIDQSVLTKLTEEGYKVIYDEKDIVRYDAILDATNEGGWLSKSMINPKAWIASPGVPVSLDDEAYDEYSNRLIHDYLQIGVATMLASACGCDKNSID